MTAEKRRVSEEENEARRKAEEAEKAARAAKEAAERNAEQQNGEVTHEVHGLLHRAAPAAQKRAGRHGKSVVHGLDREDLSPAAQGGA